MTDTATSDDVCPSTFVLPGEDRVRRCAGRFGHTGADVMHGGDGAVWGDGAAADNHPAEPLMIRTSTLLSRISVYSAALEAVAALHADRDGRCPECCCDWPCRTAKMIVLIPGGGGPEREEIIAAANAELWDGPL